MDVYLFGGACLFLVNHDLHQGLDLSTDTDTDTMRRHIVIVAGQVLKYL